LNLLLDECIDRRLAKQLKGHTVKTVPQMGWATIENGRLLALAEGRFDVFITVDRNLSFQQHLPKYNVGVIVIQSRSNRIDDLKPLVPAILSALPKCRAGRLIRVGAYAR
jgi:hypothetical protein